MKFVRVDASEFDAIKSARRGAPSQYAAMAELLMKGEMLWTTNRPAYPSLRAALHYRGWKVKIRTAERDGQTGFYLWAELKEPQP